MTDQPFTPIPGHSLTFDLPPGMSTAKANRLLRDTTDLVIAEQVKQVAPYSMLRHATANYDRRKRQAYLRSVVPAHYSHGFGTPHRDTSTARYTPTLREVTVYFPPNYRGFDHPTTDDWLTTRVRIWDALLSALLQAGATVASTAEIEEPPTTSVVDAAAGIIAAAHPDNR